ncbi:MAG: phosphate butyryltransferase [Muribaculaceae bacterium]|nr:phosphate butyryltransferase [Muribaculaceae bacterium]
MEAICNFEGLTKEFTQLGRRIKVVIVCPEDEATTDVVKRCIDEDVVDLTLVAYGDGLVTATELTALSDGKVKVVEASDVDDAALKGTKIVHNGDADVLMKGCINTDNLLRAILNKECGLLPQGHVLSHITLVQIPDRNKLLMFSDAAVIPRPTLDQLDAMVRYDVAAAHCLGIECPKTALIHFTEKVNPKFPHTLDYVIIKERAAAGNYGKMLIGGPMDVKTACDAHSGEVKGIMTPVTGDADILIFPNLEAANTFYKTISLFGHADMAGIMTGTTAPVVIPSRADSAESKYCSLAFACLTIQQ